MQQAERMRPIINATDMLNRRRWRLAACIALVGLGGIALVLSLPGYRPRDWLVQRWQQQMPQLPETEVLPLMRRLAGLGDEGTAAVVEFLASEREVEVEAAQVAISEQVDAWRLLRRDASALRVLHLAEATAKAAPRFPPASRRFASELTTQLLLWPTEDAADAEKVVVWGEAILAAVHQGKPKDEPAETQSTLVMGVPAQPSPARMEVVESQEPVSLRGQKAP